MADSRIEFRYDIADVTSAQRMRFIYSMQFKAILALWALTVLLMALSIFFPKAFTFFVDVTWTLVGQISLVYFGTLVLVLLVLPWLGFHFNRFWKLPLVFQFNSKSLRLSVAGKTGGLRLDWSQVKRVEGTQRVYVIYYEDGQKHFLLPRSAFTPAQDRRFHQMLERYGPDAARSEPDAARTPPDAARTPPDAARTPPDAARTPPGAAPTTQDSGGTGKGSGRKRKSPAKAQPLEAAGTADEPDEDGFETSQPDEPPAGAKP